MNEKEPTVFDLALRDCVEETIREVLGKGVSEAFMRHVYGRLGSTVDAVPDREAALFNALRNLFGVGGDTIGRRIVRKLYAKAKPPRCVSFLDDSYFNRLRKTRSNAVAILWRWL